MNMKRAAIAVILVSLLGLSGCSKLESPEEYTIQEESVISFSAVLGDDAGKLTALTAPEEPEEEKDKDKEKDKDGEEETQSEEEPAEELPEEYIYEYGKLEAGGTAMETYVTALLALEAPFAPVNEDMTPAELPDFTAEEGALILLRATAQETIFFRLDLSWTKEGCIVGVTAPEIDLPDPEEEPEPEPEPEEPETLTPTELTDYIASLPPSTFELEGESMSEYRVYFSEGSVMVDGKLCSKVQIYQIHQPEGSNAFVGNYIIARDKSHIYRVEDGNIVVDLSAS